MEIRHFDRTTTRSFPEHSPIGGGVHEHFELLYIYKGSCTLQWLGTTYNVERPSLFLIPSYSPHLLRSDQEAQFFYIELKLHDKSEAPALPAVLQWNTLQARAGQRDDTMAFLYSCMHLLADMFERYPSPHPPQLLRAALLDIQKIFALIECCLIEDKRLSQEGDTAYDKYVAVQAIMRYLETNYHDKITLHKLSELVHISGPHIIRLFKEHISQTPFQYLEALRMHAAESYLENSPLAVQEIAALTGYSGIHYFSRQFKRKHKMSPTHWKRHLALDGDPERP